MAKSTLSMGSSGEEVKELQRILNSAGYSLDVDGEFGSKTQSAVKNYQKSNGLAVDGIVGKNTWASLTGRSSNSGTGNKSNTTNKSNSSKSKTNKSSTVVNTAKDIKPPISGKRPEYQKSDEITALENRLTDWEKNKPGEYESKYSQEIEGILSDILNREEFSYNMNADPLYNQYKEQYIKDGKKAMMDTVANAAALTGGYANSYAVTAGNEAYSSQLEKMNDVALALYDRAYEKYRDEGDTLIDRITILRGLDGDDYKKYRDELSDYYKDGDYLLNKLTSMSDAEFNAFLAEVDAYESDREYEYNKYLDSVEQRNFYDRLQMENNQFNDEMDFKESEAERDQRNKDREYSLSLSKSSGSSASSRSSSSSGRSGSSGSKSDNNSTKTTVVPKSYSQFVYYTGYAGILTESEFNSRKASKEKYGNYENYLVEMFAKYGGKQ